METRRLGLSTLAAVGIAVGAVGAAAAQGIQGGMGCGMMQGGMGRGMMQGMMNPGMMQGGIGQGMMPGGMGQGMMPGMGPGTMALGMAALFGSRVIPVMNLSVEDVRSYLAMQLERLGNERLKIGDVNADDGTITADIVTVDDSLVQQLKVDRRTGAIEYQS